MKRPFFIFLYSALFFCNTAVIFAEEAVETTTSPVVVEQPEETAPPAAPKEEPLSIVELEVRGNQIVSTSTILSKIKSQKGTRLAQEVINEDIKRLYAAGFFQDIRMDIEEVSGGFKLIVLVDEKPIIRKIAIQGYTVFKEDKIRKSLKLIEGQILDHRAVKKGVEEIQKMYAGKGFRFVEVNHDIDVNTYTKEATITINILEGQKYKIKDIHFEGVTAFKPKKLSKLMKTKKDKLFTSGVFKEETFQKDLEQIKLYYQQEGYLDVKAIPDFQYDEAENKIEITIVIEEGQHYVTGEINIEGNEIFPESEIWQELEMLPGLTYSQFYLFQDVEKIRSYYSDRGYIEARVVPDVRMNRDSGKVDVSYQIQEGDMFFVDKVVVRGNTKTKDIVIRRELRIRPGEKFDGEQIETSKQRLQNLGFFEEVTYDTEPVATADNRKNIIFRVKERRTGELSFGGGVSSVDRFVGFAEISQKNFDLWNFPRFTGGGQSLSVRARIGSINQDFNISFVEPYIFNRPISFGADIFNIRRDDTNLDFDQERRGFSLTLSKLLKDIYRVGTGYTLERVELDDIASDAPLTVTNFEGTNWLSRVRFFGSRDTRDNIFNPTKGHLLTASGDLVGGFLGGNQDFYTLQTSFTQYWGFFKKHLLEFKVRLGTSQEFGSSDEVPIFDRFYAGGLGSVRGYNFRRVGPIQAGDAVGGESLAVMNLEYSFPIPALDAFRLAFFTDLGHVNEESYKIDLGEFAISVGPGLKVKTPIGPVAFYYGLPIANKDTEDENGRFEFSLSRGF